MTVPVMNIPVLWGRTLYCFVHS